MRPKPDLPRRLPVTKVRPGTWWFRIHARARDAMWFGPGPGSPPIHRFDDPHGRFRVCYLGTTIDVSFAETFLRNPPVRILGLDDLEERAFATIEVRRELRLAPLHGPALARLGTTVEPAQTADYSISQAWSRALWEHRDKPDGLAYRSRHDDSALCVALFDRAKSAVGTVDDQRLTEDAKLLARLLRRYGIALTR